MKIVTDQIKLPIKMLDPGLETLSYAQQGDAGADLRSTIDCQIGPGQRVLIPTGVAIALPAGYVGLVHPRSGLAVKHGITLVNTPGTIDSGYRGEIKVCLLNTDRERTFTVNRSDRIAQLVIQSYTQAQFMVTDRLPDSARGEAGFGSTGVH